MPHLPEDHRVPEVDVGGRRVEADLDRHGPRASFRARSASSIRSTQPRRSFSRDEVGSVTVRGDYKGGSRTLACRSCRGFRARLVSCSSPRRSSSPSACGDTMTGPKATPTPAQPTPTPGAPHMVFVGRDGSGQPSNVFVDPVSGTSTSTIHVGDTIQWVWRSGTHSSTSGACAAGCVAERPVGLGPDPGRNLSIHVHRGRDVSVLLHAARPFHAGKRRRPVGPATSPPRRAASG